MKQKNLIIGAVVTIAALGIGFFGGMQFQKTRRVNTFLGGNLGRNVQNGGNVGTRTGNTRGKGFQPVSGEIQSVDGSTTITVKLTNGGSKIVVVSDTTTISKSSSAVKDDLKVGEKITAFGSAGSDGTVTATNIQLNPTQMGGPNGAGQMQQP